MNLLLSIGHKTFTMCKMGLTLYPHLGLGVLSPYSTLGCNAFAASR